MKNLCIGLIFGLILLLICHVQCGDSPQEFKCPSQEEERKMLDKCTSEVADDPREAPCVVKCMLQQTGCVLPNGLPDMDRVLAFTAKCEEDTEPHRALMACFKTIPKDQAVPKDTDKYCAAYNPLMDCVMRAAPDK